MMDSCLFSLVIRGEPSPFSEEWKSMVAMQIKKCLPLKPVDFPLSIEISYSFSPPEVVKSNEPALAVLNKVIFDIMREAGFWLDDAIVFELWTWKFYASCDCVPSVFISVWRREDENE